MGTKLLIAEDHPFVTRTVKTILESVRFDAFDEVDTCKELLQELKKQKYSHLVLDLTLGDGDVLKILPGICHEHPNLQIMVFSERPASLYRELLKEEYGIQNYISKSQPEPATIKQLLDFLENKRPMKSGLERMESPLAMLSVREKQVLTFFCQGWNAREISEQLNISPETVRGYKKRILEKMNAGTILEVKNRCNLFI